MKEIDAAVVKATFRDDDPPKEKHVAFLVNQTFSSRDPNRLNEIFDSLRRRTSTKFWEVAAKILIVVHRILREGDPLFFNCASKNATALNLRSFVDESSSDAWGESRFISFYSDYLASKLAMFRKHNFSIEQRLQRQGPDWIKGMDSSVLFPLAKDAQIVFSSLLCCEVYNSAVGIHPISVAAWINLLRDSFQLYTFLSIVVFLVLDRFQKSSRSECEMGLEIFKEFVRHNDIFEKWCSSACALGIIEKDLLPDFESVPKQIVHTLQDYLDTHDFETTEQEKEKKGKKKRVKKKSTKTAPEQVNNDLFIPRLRPPSSSPTSRNSMIRSNSGSALGYTNGKAATEFDLLGLDDIKQTVNEKRDEGSFDLLSWGAPREEHKSKKETNPFDSFW